MVPAPTYSQFSVKSFGIHTDRSHPPMPKPPGNTEAVSAGQPNELGADSVKLSAPLADTCANSATAANTGDAKISATIAEINKPAAARARFSEAIATCVANKNLIAMPPSSVN